jgi:VIT1/CCC1 family predicted Fe2+/Mn2+ transporter
MDFLTWLPFRDQETQRICEHLGPQERVRLNLYGAFGGAFLAVGFAVLIVVYLAYHQSALSFPTCLIVVAVDLIAIGVGGTHIRRRMKAFLASTAWAGAQREEAGSRLKC